MSTKKVIATVLVLPCTAVVFQICGLAHSSWTWTSSLRAYELIPLTLVFTVAVEYCSITFISKVGKPLKTLIVVGIANIIIFLGTLFVLYKIMNFPQLSFAENLDLVPFIIGPVFIVAVIIIKIPLVFTTLKANVSNSKSYSGQQC